MLMINRIYILQERDILIVPCRLFLIFVKQHNLLEIIAQRRNQMYQRCGKQGPDK